MTRKHSAKTLLAVGTILLTAIPANAQKQTPPQGSAPKPFTVPAHETYSLPNGMKVTLVPYGNLPKVTVSLVVNSGNLNEAAELPGLADLTGHLMKEGTKTRSSKRVAEEAADMGGTLDINVGADESDVSTDVLSEFGPKGVALVADVTRNPLFPESELARIKNDMLRQLTIQKSVPQNIALERFRKLLYGEHPYGTVFATEDSIQKSTLADVKKYYDTNFGAQRTHLYVAGRFSTPAVKKAIAANFGTWAKGPAPAPDIPQVKPNHTLDLTDRPGAAQSTLYVGLPAPNATSEDNISLLVTNAILGGSFGSRITSNIREQKGYTYSPSSQISRRYHDAYWAEIADVTTKFTGPSLKEIFGEIERLQKEPPTVAELKGIQNYLSGIFVIQNSSRGALIAQLRFANLQGLGDSYLTTYVQRVNAVTPKDVQRITAQYIKPEEMTIVVVGDKASVMEQLAPYMTGNSQTH
ncbi:MAG TPA: pitrilysin family protein [Candidatus Sulfotelmatobacter sp.]|jgi:zinc protease|nr:pitrilysin family protein [Candidatus Sulfotelmatobacter sp.]